MPTYNNQNMGSFIWVNSEKEAAEYPVMANSGVLIAAQLSITAAE